MERQKLCKTANTILNEKKKFRGETVHDFNTCYKATVIRTVRIGERITTDQWNRMESPEIDSQKYSQLTFYKGINAI